MHTSKVLETGGGSTVLVKHEFSDGFFWVKCTGAEGTPCRPLAG